MACSDNRSVDSQTKSSPCCVVRPTTERLKPLRFELRVLLRSEFCNLEFAGARQLEGIWRLETSFPSSDMSDPPMALIWRGKDPSIEYDHLGNR